MKKLISMILLAAIVLGLCACTGSGNDKKTEGLQVGFGRANITPDFSCGMGGYGDTKTRRSTGVLSYLYADCVAFTEGDETALVYCLDAQSVGQDYREIFREAVSEATGIAKDHIFFSATHTHNGAVYGDEDEQAIKYKAIVINGVVEAAKDALEDRAKATIYAGAKELKNMNFVRHYVMSDGSYAGSNFGDLTSLEEVAHATETDPALTLYKFDREDESKKDVLLVNWAAHADHASENYNYLSADYPGAIRDEVEATTDLLCMFIPGAGGNQNPHGRIEGEDHEYKHMKKYGQALGKEAVAYLPELQKIEDTTVAVTSQTVDVPVDHSWDHMLKEAEEIWALWNSGNRDEANRMARALGMSGAYHARTIRGGRAELGETLPVEIAAIRIGDIAFVNHHYEMFSDAGLYIKANSPYAFTVVCEGNGGYIASKEAFDYVSYESSISNYARGSAEMLAEKFVEMLKSLK